MPKTPSKSTKPKGIHPMMTRARGRVPSREPSIAPTETSASPSPAPPSPQARPRVPVHAATPSQPSLTQTRPRELPIFRMPDYPGVHNRQYTLRQVQSVDRMLSQSISQNASQLLAVAPRLTNGRLPIQTPPALEHDNSDASQQDPPTKKTLKGKGKSRSEKRKKAKDTKFLNAKARRANIVRDRRDEWLHMNGRSVRGRERRARRVGSDTEEYEGDEEAGCEMDTDDDYFTDSGSDYSPPHTPQNRSARFQTPQAPSRPTRRVPRTPSSPIAGPSRFTGAMNLGAIQEQDDESASSSSYHTARSYQLPQLPQLPQANSFTHMSVQNASSAATTGPTASEAQVSNQLFVLSQDGSPYTATQSPGQAQRIPIIDVTTPQVQPFPINYPRNMALRHAPTQLNFGVKR